MNRAFKAAVVALMLAIAAAFGIAYFPQLRAGAMYGYRLATELVAAAPFEKGIDAYYGGDYAAAVRLLRSPADKGNAEAQFLLGDLYIAKAMARRRISPRR